MAFETAIDNSSYNPHHFEPIAEQSMPRLGQFMHIYVSENYLDQHDIFTPDEARINVVGADLARQLIGVNALVNDTAAMRRCLRFGLSLCRDLTQKSPGYMAGLNSLEVVLAKGYAHKLVESSYERYLSGQQTLLAITHENLPSLTYGASTRTHNVGRSVISFVLEEADRETYVAQGAQNLDRQIAKLLGRPPEV